MSGSGEGGKKKKLSPFDIRKQNCPICSKTNDNRSVKSRLYIRKDLDPDTRPRRYSWTDKRYEHMNPRLYAINNCRECCWASDVKFFEDPGKGSSIPSKTLAAEIRNQWEGEPHASVVAVLKKGLVYDKHEETDYMQAVKRHYLALYNQLMLKGVINREPFHVARFSLRLAWLFRDIYSSAELKKQWGAAVEELVQSIAQHWPEVPKSERELLEISIEYYRASLTQSRMINTARDETEFMLLVARIYMKLGQVPQAREFLALGKSKVMNFEQETRKAERKAQQERDKKQEDAAIKDKAEVRRMKLSFDNVQNVFDDIQQMWEEKQIEDAQKLIEKNSHLAAEELRKLLVKNDIDSRIAKKLCPDKQKKGFFGSLFG